MYVGVFVYLCICVCETILLDISARIFVFRFDWFDSLLYYRFETSILLLASGRRLTPQDISIPNYH